MECNAVIWLSWFFFSNTENRENQLSIVRTQCSGRSFKTVEIESAIASHCLIFYAISLVSYTHTHTLHSAWLWCGCISYHISITHFCHNEEISSDLVVLCVSVCVCVTLCIRTVIKLITIIDLWYRCIFKERFQWQDIEDLALISRSLFFQPGFHRRCLWLGLIIHNFDSPYGIIVWTLSIEMV